MSDKPILYSFRRCPYAIRARLALQFAKINVSLREISLKNKPKDMLEASPKGTVPVLIEPSGLVVEESLDIIYWALNQNDPLAMMDLTKDQARTSEQLIEDNDDSFTKILHRFKYPDFYPDVEFVETTSLMNDCLAKLDARLKANKFLVKNGPSPADIAIFPFVRQRERINALEFRQLDYPHIFSWLDWFYAREEYGQAMKKFSLWLDGFEHDF